MKPVYHHGQGVIVEGIRITTDRTVDPHSLDSVIRDIIRSGMTNEEKALACYDVVRRGMFQYPWVYDVRERREEWHDAVKLLNTYGHGLCGIQARTLGALYRKVFGFDNTRLIGVTEAQPGDWEMEVDCGAFTFSRMQKGYSLQNRQGHTTVEVFYDGHWHHLDPTVEFYAYTRDGSRIAGIEDTMGEPSLVTNPSRSIPGLMPDGDLSQVFYKSQLAPWKPGPGYFIVMDTAMDLTLKPGQGVTWFWAHPHRRFFWPDPVAERFVQDYFQAGPRHPDPAVGAWRHYGNGTFSTRVDRMTAPEGLSLPFPYVLVGGKLSFRADTEGLRLLLCCEGASDGEMTVETHTGEQRVDLSDFVMGGYGLDLSLEGKGNIGDLRIDLYFQHNFITRPRLLPGENVIRLTGESDGFSTPLQIAWEWEEVDGIRQDRRDVTPPDEYAIALGGVPTDPPENPKYMVQLTVARPSDIEACG